MATTKAETWTNSFVACNLDPRNRLSFPDWCKKIDSVLVGGQMFTKEERLPEEHKMYALLPSFWHGMTSEEKKVIMKIVSESEHGFDVDCCRKLHHDHHIPYKDLQHVRVCYELAIEYPSHLDKGALSSAEVLLAEQLPEEVKKAHETTRNINGGLDLFQLKPPGMKGIELFDHMIKHRKITGNGEAEEPGNYLAAEMSKDQKNLILNLSDKDFARRELMKDAD